MKPEYLITLIITAYEDSAYMDKCIQSVEKAVKGFDKLIEIILVDNSPSGLNLKRYQKFTKWLRILREEKTGLSQAKNRGIIESGGGYIGFLDDDAYLPPDYFKIVLSKIKNNEEIDGIGGVIVPIFDGQKPAWFADKWEGFTMGEKERYLIPNESFCGSNMFFHKRVFEEVGMFDVNLGMKGRSLGLSEETNLIRKIFSYKNHQAQLLYCPSLKVFHHIAGYKLSVSYRLKRSFYGGKAKYLMSKVNGENLLEQTVKYLIGGGFMVCFSLVRIFQFQHPKRWLVESFSPVFYAAGFISMLVGL